MLDETSDTEWRWFGYRDVCQPNIHVRHDLCGEIKETVAWQWDFKEEKIYHVANQQLN